jgi:hypothetical protein
MFDSDQDGIRQKSNSSYHQLGQGCKEHINKSIPGKATIVISRQLILQRGDVRFSGKAAYAVRRKGLQHLL